MRVIGGANSMVGGLSLASILTPIARWQVGIWKLWYRNCSLILAIALVRSLTVTRKIIALLGTTFSLSKNIVHIL